MIGYQHPPKNLKLKTRKPKRGEDEFPYLYLQKTEEEVLSELYFYLKDLCNEGVNPELILNCLNKICFANTGSITGIK